MTPETVSGAAGLSESAETDDELLLRRKRKVEPDLIAGLNLTAMMDIMTIILVYLIKLYAEAPENVTLNDDLRPPASTAPATIQPTVSVLISKTAVLVDNKPVLTIESQKVISPDAANPYRPVKNALDDRVSVIREIERRGGSPFDGTVMIIADADTSYDILSSVLYQAGKAGFTSYRLVVRHK